ncbi:MAG: TraM recognition domain-containing protein [Chloroflexi bacterium]|nr:TraM recognition domain-containing protein [Chloroflexota bacterium]
MARPRLSGPGQRALTRIGHEADLLPFRETDPYMLPSALHGDARWAWLQHLWRAGMFATCAEWAECVRGYPLSAMWFTAGETLRVDGNVCFGREGHRLIVGSPGSGKFTCAISLLLLEDDGANAFVIDPKGGEAFRFTAVFRDQLGEGGDLAVRLLDPCGLYAGVAPSESINPLDIIRPDNPNLVGDVDKLVDALVIVSGHEREPVWAMSAKKVLRAIILHIATFPSAARSQAAPTLMDVQRVVSEDLDEAFLLEMAENPIAEDLVVRAALEISALKKAEGTWRGVKFQIDASLAFLDNPGVRKTLAVTSFDVTELRRRRLSLYVVLPNKEKEALARWLRLTYATVMESIDGVAGRDLHVVVDEFAALGKFDRVLSDLATMRSAGLRYHIAVQDLNQLQELYGHGWQTIVGNCSVRQFLGVNDNFTADYVSRALGQTTVHDGDDFQQEYPDSPPQRRPRFVGRELMTPAEVVHMDRDWMIVFADRCRRPLRLPKTPYYQAIPWRERAADLSPADHEA